MTPQIGSQKQAGIGDIDGFARNLVDVLDSPRYRENAVRHRRDILERYDWRSISAQTENIYEQVRARP